MCFRVVEQTVKCQDGIVLNSEVLADHLVIDDNAEGKSNTITKKQGEGDASENVESEKDSVKSKRSPSVTNAPGLKEPDPQYTLKHDGDYLFVIHIGGSSFQAQVELEIEGTKDLSLDKILFFAMDVQAFCGKNSFKQK